jgi:hypothetical protein
MVLNGNVDAARSEDPRVALVALRDTLAAAVDGARPDMLPQIAGQYRAVLKDLAGLPTVKVVSKQDELKARRAARRSTSKASGVAKQTGGKRGA